MQGIARKWRSGRLNAALTLALLISAAGPAAADDLVERAAQARVQFLLGLDLYEQGDFEQAVVAFETANKLNPSYKILYNVAQTENELKRYARAIRAYRDYLDGGGDEMPAGRAAQVREEIARLKPLVGGIVLATGMRGALVFINGERRGITPVEEPIVVDLGDHEVVVKRGARVIHREIVRVGGGLTVHLELEAEEGDGTAPSENGDGPDGRRLWTWVALGIGGAAGIGAAVTGGMALSRSDDLESSCTDGICGPEHRDTLDSARSLALATDVLIGVTAVGVAAAAVLFFVEPGLNRGEEGVEVTTGPTWGPGTVGWTVGGRF